MLGYHTQNQGSTAGLTLYASQGYSYNLPVQHLLHSKPDTIQWNNTASLPSRELPSWANSLRQYTKDMRTIEQPAARPSMAATAVEPADLSRMVDIEFAAFRDEHINHHLSYRNGTDSWHLKRTLRTYRKYMNNLRSVLEDNCKLSKTNQAQRLRSDSACECLLGFRFRKVESPVGGEIIAFCKSEMAKMTSDDMNTPLDAGHEGEPQMNRDWFALNERYHREYCGTRMHCYFGMLATHPDHQHQGAASMLMDELVAEADRLRVEIYCEATKTGRPLYEKYGFVAVKEIEFATADYGVDLGKERQTVMVRGALGGDGKRCRVRTWDEALADSAFVLS